MALARGLGSFAARTLLGTLSGSGAYRIRKNTVLGGAVPMFTGGTDGVVLRHREYLGDVTASTVFTPTSYSINPGDYNTFPWLSTVAQQFEEYRFRGLVFCYKASSGFIGGTSPALGNVMLATQYDVLDPAFPSKQIMDSYEYSDSVLPTEACLHGVECDRSLTPLPTLYIRHGAAPAGSDPRLFDLGIFTIATTGQQASNFAVGELWVTYDVELLKPRIDPRSTLSSVPNYLHQFAASHTATAAVPMGTGITTTAGSTILTQFAGVTSGNTFMLPGPGVFGFCCVWSGATGIGSSPTLTPGANIGFGDLTEFASSVTYSSYNTGGTQAIETGILYCTAPGTGAANQVTVSGLSSMTNAQFDLWLWPVANVNSLTAT
jgi:hypothetical protein